MSSTTPGYSANGTSLGAKAIVNRRQESENQPINSSRCQIASLEVYRGREQAIAISHNGFSLGNGSNLEVSTLVLREIIMPSDFLHCIHR